MRSRTPKVLHMVCGRPMIDWVIAAVAEAGADTITVVVNPHHAELAAHLSEKDPTIEVVYQREPKGTAHALEQVENLKGDVLVVNGDSPLLTSGTVKRVVAAHRGAKRPATLASVVDPTRDDGRIVRGTDGEFEKIVERKDADDQLRQTIHEFNVGIYCFDGARLKDALAQISNTNKAGEYYLTDVFLNLKPVNIVTLADPNEAMGVKDRIRLAAAVKIMQRRILERLMEDGVTIVDPDTSIQPFSVIKGKTEIGSECRIGPHVHIEDARIGDRSDCGPFVKIRPGTEIAEDVHIGSFAELVRTKVGRNSKVPHVSYLGDTDLGEDANIGAGTITANFDGTHKNRTEIGDGAFVGVDTMLVAPVKLGRGARTGAGSGVTKDVPDGATAVGVPARVVRRKS